MHLWGGRRRNREDKNRWRWELIERRQVRRDTRASVMDVTALCETVAVVVFLPYWLLFYLSNNALLKHAANNTAWEAEMHLQCQNRAAQDRFVQIKARQWILPVGAKMEASQRGFDGYLQGMRERKIQSVCLVCGVYMQKKKPWFFRDHQQLFFLSHLGWLLAKVNFL